MYPHVIQFETRIQAAALRDRVTVRAARRRRPRLNLRVRGTSLAFAAVATALLAAGSASAKTACTEGVTKVGGVNARTFCGPAHATVTVGSKSFTLRGGSCSKSSFGFTINIGTVVLGTVTKKPDYFGITTPAKAGTVKNGAVALVHAGKDLAALGPVTLKAGLRSGTFTGKVFGSPTKVTGTFTC